MTLSDLRHLIESAVAPSVGGGEARAISYVILEDLLGVTKTKLFTDGDRTVEPETVGLVRKITDRIVGGEPVQYVLGSARFMGLDYKVTPATLIPRPETEGLVDLITDESQGRRNLRVLDIGVGSGCISIALQRALVYPDVEGIDISPDAVRVAEENSSRLVGGKVRFAVADIFRAVPEPESYDIIVSNPPYIADSEKADMEPRVYEHEPSSALFVPDRDPLVFYRTIAGYAAVALADNGRLYFEINPRFAVQLSDLLESKGFSDVRVVNDYLGRRRFIRATLCR